MYICARIDALFIVLPKSKLNTLILTSLSRIVLAHGFRLDKNQPLRTTECPTMRPQPSSSDLPLNLLPVHTNEGLLSVLFHLSHLTLLSAVVHLIHLARLNLIVRATYDKCNT